MPIARAWLPVAVIGMSLVAVGNLNQDALAQTDRDLLPVGMEFCMLATEDPVRADNFATASGFAARQINSNTTSYARSGEGPFMTARVYRQESGDFAVECGFRVDAVGEISSDEVSQLASRFGLEHIGPRGATHFMSRQTPHLITNVYARATDGIPCPGDGRLEIAPELLEEHPEVLDQVMQVCDKLGFEVVVQSAYSVSEIER